MSFLLDRERELVRHALGCWDGCGRRTQEGYRNYFVAAIDSPNDRVWQSLVTRGLATVRPFPFNEVEPTSLYYATREGARLAGLSEAAIVRACGTREEQAKQCERRERERERRRVRTERRWMIEGSALALARAYSATDTRRPAPGEAETRRREAAGE